MLMSNSCTGLQRVPEQQAISNIQITTTAKGNIFSNGKGKKSWKKRTTRKK